MDIVATWVANRLQTYTGNVNEYAEITTANWITRTSDGLYNMHVSLKTDVSFYRLFGIDKSQAIGVQGIWAKDGNSLFVESSSVRKDSSALEDLASKMGCLQISPCDKYVSHFCCPSRKRSTAMYIIVSSIVVLFSLVVILLITSACLGHFSTWKLSFSRIRGSKKI